MLHHIESHIEGAETVLVELYKNGFSNSADRMCYRLDGQPANWGLDMRKPFSWGRLLLPACDLIAEKVSSLGLHQIAGIGFGSCFLIGGILVARPDWKGGVIRDRRKEYGFREIVEGSLDRRHPVALVDDVVASGGTIFRAATTLLEEGFQPCAVVPLFKFDWYQSHKELENLGIEVVPVATVNYAGFENAKVIWESPAQNSVRWMTYAGNKNE